MTTELAKPGSQVWREPTFWAMLAVVLFAYLFRLDGLSIRGEESRWTVMGQEMARTGDWVVPRWQGEPFLSRPPLHSGLIAVSTSMIGVNEWGVRLPSVLAVTATCVLLYWHARRFVGSIGAFSAAVSFATMIQVLELGRFAETEAVFTCLTFAALCIWHRGIISGWPDALTWTCAYALAGFAALAKGVQAPVYLFATSAVYLWWTGSWRRFFSLGHALGVIAFGVVVGSWFLACADQLGWHGAKQILMSSDTTARFDYSKPGPFIVHLLSYPVMIFGGMLPWSLLLFGYARRDLRERIGDAAPLVQFAAIACFVAFPTCWLVPLAKTRYYLPLFPCFGLLVGVVVDRFASTDDASALRGFWSGLQRWIGVALIGLAILTAVVAVALPLQLPGGSESQPRTLSIAVLDVQPRGDLAILLGVVAIAGALMLLYQRAAIGAIAVVLIMGATVFHQNVKIDASVDVETSMKTLTEKLPVDATVHSLGPVNHRFAYYFDRPVWLVPLPLETSKLPSPGSYFCVTIYGEQPVSGAIPFAYEPIDVVWLDRYHSQRTTFVLVGRRLN